MIFSCKFRVGTGFCLSHEFQSVPFLLGHCAKANSPTCLALHDTLVTVLHNFITCILYSGGLLSPPPPSLLLPPPSPSLSLLLLYRDLLLPRILPKSMLTDHKTPFIKNIFNLLFVNFIYVHFEHVRKYTFCSSPPVPPVSPNCSFKLTKFV